MVRSVPFTVEAGGWRAFMAFRRLRHGSRALAAAGGSRQCPPCASGVRHALCQTLYLPRDRSLLSNRARVLHTRTLI